MYLGSVRFFKHCIVLIVLLAITVPTGLCISLALQNQQLNAAIEEVYSQGSSNGRMKEKKQGVISNLVSETFALKTPLQDLPAYTKLYPDLYVSSSIKQAEAPEQTVYLTFDDGPSAVTDSILDTLSQKGVKATFFVVGRQLDNVENQNRLKRIAAEGHTIGIHTETHDYRKIYTSVDAYLEDFYIAWNKVKDITGVEAQIFRFPGGSLNSYNSTIYQELVSEMLRRGFVYSDWNVSSQDAAGSKPVPIAAIVNSATDMKKYNRAIILMHDSSLKTTTAQALPQVIDILKAKGFLFEPLTEKTRPIVFTYLE